MNEHTTEHDSTQYCWDFNEQGYCKTCGQSATPEPKFIEPFHLTPPSGKWPTNTWFQKRRLEVATRELTATVTLSKVQS